MHSIADKVEQPLLGSAQKKRSAQQDKGSVQGFGALFEDLKQGAHVEKAGAHALLRNVVDEKGGAPGALAAQEGGRQGADSKTHPEGHPNGAAEQAVSDQSVVLNDATEAQTLDTSGMKVVVLASQAEAVSEVPVEMEGTDKPVRGEGPLIEQTEHGTQKGSKELAPVAASEDGASELARMPAHAENAASVVNAQVTENESEAAPAPKTSEEDKALVKKRAEEQPAQEVQAQQGAMKLPHALEASAVHLVFGQIGAEHSRRERIVSSAAVPVKAAYAGAALEVQGGAVRTARPDLEDRGASKDAGQGVAQKLDQSVDQVRSMAFGQKESDRDTIAATRSATVDAQAPALKAKPALSAGAAPAAVPPSATQGPDPTSALAGLERLGGHADQGGPPAITIRSLPYTSAWTEEVGQKLTWIATGNLTEADLVLTPEALGRVSVSMKFEGEVANMVFVAEHEDARLLIEQTLSELKTAMQESGITLDEMRVSVINASEGRNTGSGGAATQGDRRESEAFARSEAQARQDGRQDGRQDERADGRQVHRASVLAGAEAQRSSTYLNERAMGQATIHPDMRSISIRA